MPVCNIDQTGKTLRVRGGMLVALVGSIMFSLLFLHVLEHTAWWFVAGFVFVSGAFMLFEGLAGWCVLRAMGIRTRI